MKISVCEAIFDYKLRKEGLSMGCKFRAAECVGLNAEENVERFEQNIVKVSLH